MHNKGMCVFFLVVGCSLIFAAQTDISLAKAQPPSAIPIVGDVEKKTTTTAAPTTTTPTTTPAPTTSTAPTTTTTTTKSPDTTTKAPDTTTTPAPTSTTPAPQPFPEPEIGTWNSSCIMVKFAAQLHFTYETKDNKTKTGLYNIPKDSKVYDSVCDTTQTLHVNWGPADYQHSMLLQFDMVNKSSVLTMLRFVIPLLEKDFPDAKENENVQLIHYGSDFSAPAKMSYHCTRPQKLNLTETIGNQEIIGTVKLHDVQVEAFRPANTTGFSVAHDCDSSEPSDIVPIAVGIALAALIAIVLVAYLCARRRSTSRGYVSF